MSTRRPTRVVAAVDASAVSLAAAAEAAALAARLGVELVGLFVEDREILRLAELPAVVEADRLTVRTRRPERAALELELRALAARARSAFERATAPHLRAVTFRVERGAVGSSILAAVDERDLVALGLVGSGGGGAAGLGRTARELIERFAGELLVTPRPTAPTGVRRLDAGIATGVTALLLPRLDEPKSPAVLDADGARDRRPPRGERLPDE